MEILWGFRAGKKDDPSKRQDCYYHVHGEGNKCALDVKGESSSPPSSGSKFSLGTKSPSRCLFTESSRMCHPDREHLESIGFPVKEPMRSHDSRNTRAYGTNMGLTACFQRPRTLRIEQPYDECVAFHTTSRHCRAKMAGVSPAYHASKEHNRGHCHFSVCDLLNFHSIFCVGHSFRSQPLLTCQNPRQYLISIYHKHSPLIHDADRQPKRQCGKKR
jgi:hypothetical protein